MTAAASPLGPRPMQFFGGWEAGLLAMMVLLYLAGAFINPNFFGSLDAFQALLRDSARYAVMAVGMTFVIANKDLDLSVGSTFGLVTVIFAYAFNPAHYDMGVGTAIVACFVLGTAIGLINGVLVTMLRVPAFIATLTMLFIGRGFVLGLTGGQSILYPVKAREFRWFFQLGEFNAWGFNNQIPIALVVVAIGAVVLAKTRWGYETFATGGNEQAAIYAGIPTRWVRIRAYLLASWCATIAGLMAVAQDKGTSPQSGLSAELIVIASVIIGGASILGGRGRVLGSFLGAVLVVLINKVLREGWPITRTLVVDGAGSAGAGGVHAAGGRRACLSRRAFDPRRADRADPHPEAAAPPPVGSPARAPASRRARQWRRRHRRRADKGSMATDKAMSARGFGKFLARRDALAIILTVILWLVGLYLRPDYWWNLPNTLRDPPQLHRARADRRRPRLRDRRRRHRPFGRRGACARRQHRRLRAEGARPRSVVGDCAWARGRYACRGDQRRTDGLARPAGIHRHARHVLHRPRRRLVARLGPAAHRLDRELQSHRPQGRRHPAIPEHPASERLHRRRHRSRERADALDDPRLGRRRNRACLHAVRPEALRHRRQHPRRRLCRHQHQPHPLHRAPVLRGLRHAWPASSTSPISAASTRSPDSSANSTASPRSSSAAARSSAATGPSSARLPEPP